MKKLVISISLIIATFSLAIAQAEAPAQNPNAPEITFEKVVHDYGTIYKGDDGIYDFTFTNTGKEPLILSNVRSSCGCTVPSWPREPILPGKSAAIKVKYNTDRPGIINKNVTVNSNARTSTVVLSIKGNVVNAPGSEAPVNPDGAGSPKVQ